jgi:hypothetical protein
MLEYRNAGDNLSPASAFFPVVICVNPASAFQRQGQSGTAGHGLVRHCPALLKIVQKAASEFLFLLSFTVLGKFSPMYMSQPAFGTIVRIAGGVRNIF